MKEGNGNFRFYRKKSNKRIVVPNKEKIMKKNLIQKNLNEQTGSLLKPYSVTFISNDEGNAPTISFSNGQE